MRPEWIDAGAINDVPVRGARIVRTPGGAIAVFRTATGAVHALPDRCPHRGGPLSQGIVHGDSVTCPLHGWVIGLASGRVEGADAGAVAPIPVRCVRGRILLSAPALRALKAAAKSGP